MDNPLDYAKRNVNYLETQINLAARRLLNVANIVGYDHLRDGLTRLEFYKVIKDEIEEQFSIAQKSKNEAVYIECIRNLNEERLSLLEQSKNLKMNVAQLKAKVEFVRENNVIVGYVISAVNIVIGGLALYAGTTLFLTGGPLGMLAGAILIADGVNTISKEVINYYNKESHSEGVLADQSMIIANFMGFKDNYGLIAYRTATLAAGVYGVFGLLRKKEAWKLYQFVRTDYYRQVTNMSRPKLAMKIYGFGTSAKVIYDLALKDSKG